MLGFRASGQGGLVRNEKKEGRDGFTGFELQDL